jgi:hypothetical protein
MGLQFMHLFWTGATKERANGKEIDPMPLKTQVPLVPPQIHGAIRSRDIKGISSLMGDSTLDEVWLSRSAPIDCFSLAVEADILIIELCDVVKKRLSWPDVKGKSIGGVESTPFLLMRSRKKCIIMNTDLGLELNKQQAEDMAKEGPKGQWTLHSGVELARLSGSVLPFDDSWDSRTEKKIETMRTVDQGSKVAKNLNDWALGIPAPEPIFDSNLVKTWKFVARLAPPTLPSDAERGRIYQMWKEFDQAFHKALADISARAEEAKEKMGKLQKLANSKKLESISEAIERASRLDMSRPTSRAEAEQRIDQIESLEGELPTLLETAAEESAEQEGQDEIQAVKKRSGKSGEPGGRMTARELRGMMPREPLPTVGTLYENKKGQQFLAIDFTDQIEEAKNIAKLYRAALVANSR